MAYKRISPQPVIEGGTGATTLTGVLIGNGTSAVTGNAVTQHDVLIGGASNAITSVAPSATSGVPLISQGASADPAFGTAVVAGGGTGNTSATAYAVLCGGTTSTAAFQSIAGVGTSGQFLTSNGAGALPTFQSAGAASITITGDSGGGLTGSSFTFTGGTTGLTFAGAGSTETVGGTLVVSNGGTGVASTTAYAVLCGGTTSTGALQSIASVGSSGSVLTSNGAGALPTFQVAGGGIKTVTINLTNAQIKALITTPITAISAGGSGTIISVLSVVSHFIYGGTNAFTQAQSADISLWYGSNSSNSNRIFPLQTFTIYSGTTSAYNMNENANPANLSYTQTIASNTAVVITLPSGDANIAGNAAADNTISAIITYQILTV